ncbi:MAG: thioredoxin domain-containing protein [Gammaproteobacteria bacterium]|nr:MAG: thioredoxin domain-containing protein [Gammaproteobacteria bacterium]TND04008.1 MAG: thioredoxin domain-containing protein [Gammaproteobacteria bacterium]
MTDHFPANHLANETSPYLLQHAHNPVQWHPWGAAALATARQQDKPILLSIGYSACHWCHVMAHESFEDEATAALMNELFVNIKVDREERPDLDKIYQLSHSLLTRRNGGWPLTVFLAPGTHVPFFAGTYFPKEPRYGMPSFQELLRHIDRVYREHRPEIDEQNTMFLNALQQVSTAPSDADAAIGPAVLDMARNQLEHSYDPAHGGFGGAPKFPHPPNLERLLRHWSATAVAGNPDGKALDMVLNTLMKMGDGGIFDQLGGGFYRYSVDERWMIPHFEKMLYDNALLLAVCAQSLQISGNPLFERLITETADWVMREMQSPDGGYYSTLDADSEGEEGKFYAWTRDEIAAVLSGNERALIERRFGFDGPPNFEHQWHLHMQAGLSQLAGEFSLSREQVLATVDAARRKLFARREQRVRPGRDEKILPAWNGLMIKGMALAGRVLNRADIIESAQRAVDFVYQTMWRNGRLLATCKDGHAHLMAYLDDHAFLLDGLLELLQTRWRRADLDFAVALAEVLLSHFEDNADGGFFFTAHDHEQLIQRPKPYADDALPAGNGVAALALQRLGHLLGETRYRAAAERAIKAAWPAVMQAPYAHNAMLAAVEEYLYPPQVIVLRGVWPDMEPWLTRCNTPYAPRRSAMAVPDDASGLPGLLGERRAADGHVVAYVCSGTVCAAPVTSLAGLDAALRDAEARAD